VSGVEVAAPKSYTSPLRVQSVRLGAGPGGGPGTVQPPRSFSNDVCVTVVPSTSIRASSRNTPKPCANRSEASEIEISTRLPAYADRSASKSFHPPLGPLTAFHLPVVPCGPQSGPQ
jgi:hypothetical protein